MPTNRRRRSTRRTARRIDALDLLRVIGHDLWFGPIGAGDRWVEEIVVSDDGGISALRQRLMRGSVLIHEQYAYPPGEDDPDDEDQTKQELDHGDKQAIAADPADPHKA
jgi:hypothetical protein